MGKSLKVECANLVARIERKQSKRLIEQLHILVECHAGNIVAAGTDAFQAFGIAGVLAGGGRVLAFGDGFVEVQNGMGETMTFRRGDEVYQSNPAADTGPEGDKAASPHGGQARVWIGPKCPQPMRQILMEVFGDVGDGGSTSQNMPSGKHGRKRCQPSRRPGSVPPWAEDGFGQDSKTTV